MKRRHVRALWAVLSAMVLVSMVIATAAIGF